MKNLEIYYINTDVDREDEAEFQRYWELTNFDEDTEVKPQRGEYTRKWRGQVDNDIGLGRIYEAAQNAYTPNEFFEGRSMMIGDIIKLDEEYFIVSRVGFLKINW